MKSGFATVAPCILAAVALAAVGTASAADAEPYAFDPLHSRIGFAVAHLGISKVKGEFTNFTGQVTLEKSGTDLLGAEIVIRTESVHTRNVRRDGHIRGEAFFDAKDFPEIRFKAEKAEKRGDTWFLAGTFTMHGAE